MSVTGWSPASPAPSSRAAPGIRATTWRPSRVDSARKEPATVRASRRTLSTRSPTVRATLVAAPTAA